MFLCTHILPSVIFLSETFAETKETFGGINIVVNNAGIGGEADDRWESVIDVNMVHNYTVL